MTLIGDVYYVGSRLIKYKQNVWRPDIDPLDKNLEYFGIVWCAIEFTNMLYFGFIAKDS